MKTKMKTKGLGAKRPNLPKGQKKKGVALLTVLTVMSLATILVLTFFTLAQSELESSTSYSQGMEAKHLSETAVNMVIGQLRKATTDDNSQKRDYAWASQPGAVRVYNETGNFKAGFKLYSDDTMTVRPPGLEAELVEKDVQELNNWSSNPAVFVDLNEPVIRGKKVFYPIVDPRAKEEQKVEGFDYTTAAVGKSPLDQAVKRADSQANSLPMPVKWLYQLEDGTMGYMSGGGNKGTFVPLANGKLPTEQNPIVGRVAFWTDDETAKLNVNTAAGGMVWDTPRTGGDIDRNFGRYQPAQHEWQRYPGHPATTSLSPVFFPGKEDIVLNRRAMDMLYELTPRVVGGGSRAGSVKAEEPNGLVADKDRLYASLDEFIFKPDRTENKFPTEFMTGSAAEVLERSRFFLTATSRAPEVTLFNTPRISIWPTYNKKNSGDEKYVTPFDNLIRFTGELGENNSASNNYDKHFQYYFQRENADNTTDDYDKIQRNRELYSYLDDLLETPIPGFGGDFRTKYGNENQNQLLTEIFDYIRSTNLFDDTVYGENWKDAYIAGNKSDHLTYTNYRLNDANEQGIHMGHGQVAPIKINHEGVDTKGFGRFYTIAEVSFMAICNADPLDGGSTVDGGAGNYSYEGVARKDYSNFPPLTGLKLGDPPDLAIWPQWLIDMYGTDGSGAEFQLAKNPANWNYLLLNAMQPVGVLPLYYPGDPFPQPVAASKPKFEEMRLKYTPSVKHEKLVQIAMLIRLFSPSQGWVPISPDMLIEVDTGGMFFGPNIQFTSYMNSALKSKYTIAGNPFKVATGDDWQGWITSRLNFANVWGGLHSGGEGGFRSLLTGTLYPLNSLGGPGPDGDFTLPTMGRQPANWEPRGFRLDDIYSKSSFLAAGRRAPFDVGVRRGRVGAENIYPWITQPFKIDALATSNIPLTMNQQFKIRIYAHRNGNALTNPSSADTQRTSQPQSSGKPDLVQEIIIHPNNMQLPVPNLVTQGSRELINEFGDIYAPTTTPMEWWSLSFDGAQALAPESSNVNQKEGLARTGRLQRASSVIENRGTSEGIGAHGLFIRQEDSLVSYVLEHGDNRLIAAKSEVKSNQDFKKHPLVGTSNRAHNLVSGSGFRFNFMVDGSNRTIEDVKSKDPRNIVPDVSYGGRRPTPLPEDSTKWQLYGDFDNGVGNFADGPYINKPDEGNTHSLNRPAPGSIPKTAYDMRRDYGDFPYFVRDWVHEPGGASYFSPNRIMPGPGMFGSLPTAVLTPTGTGLNKGAWQTLLFRPDVNGNGYRSHPGATSPKDHLIMDLFWMPVVEPYAISETLSTAGKVNMNYQILPFSYITRNTALRGVFKSEVMMTVPNKHAVDYKNGEGRGFGYHWKYNPYGGTLQQKSMRTFIVADKTLEQFQTEYFDKGKIFKSATEICDIHLIPKDIGEASGFNNQAGTYTPTVEQMRNGKYWRDHAVVGDNGRERPYTDIYPRLTTKSNTFKVHFRAQVLRKAKDRNPAEWDPEYDQPVGEYRGSTVVERYIEPNDPELAGKDWATMSNLPPLDKFYKYRVLNTQRFAP